MLASRLFDMLLEFGFHEPREFDNAILIRYSQDNGKTWIEVNQDIPRQDVQYRLVVRPLEAEQALVK